jgi:hypothetical protein
MIPPLTVYAISVSDSKTWFSVNTPYFGNEPKPGMQTAAPGQKPEYKLALAPGTYYVLAYFEKSYFASLPQGTGDRPGVYSRFTIDCIQATRPNASPPPACSGNDHTLVPVTVRTGETVTGIDIKDWYYVQGSYPPRPS